MPPLGWKCQKCDIREGLWLNLTDGAIMCGRRYFDGTGGNNHASEHYDATKYPLVVKLGTITPNGAGQWIYPIHQYSLLIVLFDCFRCILVRRGFNGA